MVGKRSEGGCVFACRHPAVLWTVTERCAVCPHRTVANLPGIPAAPAAEAALAEAHRATAAAAPPSRRESRQERLARKRQQRQANLGPPQPPLILTRDHQPAGLANAWFDGHLFLTLSGPSLNALPLAQLSQRGVMTMGVNNSACVVRPNLWTFVDPVEKFHQAIWHDPAIIKLVPVKRFHEKIRVREGDRWSYSERLACECPGVFGYVRGADFDPATYLTQPEVCMGNCKKKAAQNQRPHIINVMFVVFRLAYHLGFRHVYLLGCDFRMEHGQSPYAFAEEKHAGAVNSNNNSYLKLNIMLGQLAPRLQAAGMQVYNCTAKSGLVAFPHLNFAEAIHRACAAIPRTLDTCGWYTKGE